MLPKPNREGEVGAATVEDGAPAAGSCGDGVVAGTAPGAEECGAVIGDAVRTVEAAGSESACISAEADAGRACGCRVNGEAEAEKAGTPPRVGENMAPPGITTELSGEVARLESPESTVTGTPPIPKSIGEGAARYGRRCAWAASRELAVSEPP
jgi:hypothetical protein